MQRSIEQRRIDNIDTQRIQVFTIRIRILYKYTDPDPA